MNNPRGDLNLFYVFKALMEERNVGRAAERLNVSQPAVSNALNRLRHVFNDRLFVRVATGVKPTQRALDLWSQVHQSIDALSDSMFPPQFNPGEATTTFRIAITDALRQDLTVSLGNAFHAAAPNAQLQFHYHTNVTSGMALENGEIDCAVGMFPRPPQGHHVLPLLTDDYVCVLRADHPLACGELTISAFSAADHVLTKPLGIGGSTIDYWLALRGFSRRIALVVTHSSDALRIVAASDLLGCAPQRHLDPEEMAELGLVSRPLPFETERILYKLVWHERTDRLSEQKWLRQLIAAQFAISPEPEATISDRG